MKKLIEKQAKVNYELLHSRKENKGKEVHHQYGRIGVFRCCELFLIPLTKQEHNNSKLINGLREANRPLMLEVSKHYNKRFGCKKMHSLLCNTCLILNKDTRMDEFFKAF
jgi:hypothetical protein